MSRRFDRLSEAQIRKAIAEGKLSKLAGEGKPLPDRPEQALIDPGLAVGFRIMAEHGALPEEVALRKALEAAKTAYAEARSAEDKRAAMAEIAEAQMKLSIAEEARKKFLG